MTRLIFEGVAMPINSRDKGANGERELSKLLHSELGVPLRRNLDQCRGGGHDLSAPDDSILSGYAIEVKRVKSASHADLARYWLQAEGQATTAGKVPVLAYRTDRQGWRVMVPLAAVNATAFEDWQGIQWAAQISVTAFCALVRGRT